VLVLDTGLAVEKQTADRRPQHWLLRTAVKIHQLWRSVTDTEAADDDDEPNADGDKMLDAQSGHGTFIAGIVRQHCPDATIHVDGALSSHGIGDDITAGEALERALARTDRPIDVVVMSFGGYTEDDQPPPLADWIDDTLGARRAAQEADARVPGLLIVAAAGNNGSPRPMYPAALGNVVSVGALGSAGRALFSNFGGWVDACAPGVGVLSTFFEGFTERFDVEADAVGGDDATETVEVDGRSFTGWATWSGTSFSAPKVAAAIAEELYLNHIDAPEAWRRLSHWEKYRYPDLGIVFNIW
jgi:subtilisin family serine protease